MKRSLCMLAVMAFAAVPTFAETVYDAKIPFVGLNAPIDDLFIGSAGNGNYNTSNFVVTTGIDNVSVSLKGQLRYLGDLPNTLSAYYAPIGTGGHPDLATPSPGVTRWGYMAAVDVTGYLSVGGGRTLADLEYRYSIDFKPAIGNTNFFTFAVPANTPEWELATQWVDSNTFGNSWNYWDNLPYSGYPNVSNVDPNALGEYAYSLAVYQIAEAGVAKTPVLLANSSITINAVPLPAAVWAGMSLLAGLGMVRKFRSRRSQEV